MGRTKHKGPMKLNTFPAPSLWASWVPMGLGKVKPKHIRDTLKVVYENRDNLPYAYRILTQGVCDGCALGVSGLRDQTLDGPHLCTTRLNVLRLNTMPAIESKWLEDVTRLRQMNSTELRKLGRIPYPLSRKPGENHFTRISWDEALNRIASKLKQIDPRQMAFYLTARGITNEVYYAATKVARFLGTNNIDNASRICHSPSKTALKRSLGIAASSCSYKDWIGTDVLLFWGAVPANNQPVSTKYMYAAKKAGTKIILVNPYQEPSMEKYWIPSIAESAMFGTKIVDEFVQVNIGGDIALMNGIMKHWFELEEHHPGSAIDHRFVNEHVNGYEQLKQHIRAQSWEKIEQSSGVKADDIRALAQTLAKAKTAVFVWSMGLTQHRFGTDNISQIANLAMLRGFIGREHCGVMPIRGHSGVQGAGEMGAEPMSLPGGGPLTDDNIQRMEQLWGFEIPRWQGDTVGMSLENMILPDDHERKVKCFYTSGGNFLETMPNPDFVKQCLESVQLRVHQDIILNTSTLLDAEEEVIVLPAMARYEQTGGGTSTSTERMVYFSPEIEGPRIAEARAEWEIYTELAAIMYPERQNLIRFQDAAYIRQEIALANPNYDGIQHLAQRGDVFQWGGAWLCEDGVCPTDDGKGQLIAIEIPELRKKQDQYYVTTRRGKQFNSMIYDQIDPFNDADRYDIFIHPDDAAKLKLADGEAIVVYNEHGKLFGKVKLANTKQGNVQVHWPEGNALMPQGVYEQHAGIPEYNTAIVIQKMSDYQESIEKKYMEKPVQDLETDIE